VKAETFWFNWRIKNRSEKTEITQNSVALSLNPKIDHTKWLGINVKIKKRLKKICLLCSVNCVNFAFLELALIIIVVTKQIINNPYIEAVSRTELSWVKPILLKNAAGSRNDLPDMYRPAPKSGKSIAGLPRAVQFATFP
jgi:hypothetical protein